MFDKLRTLENNPRSTKSIQQPTKSNALPKVTAPSRSIQKKAQYQPKSVSQKASPIKVQNHPKKTHMVDPIHLSPKSNKGLLLPITGKVLQEDPVSVMKTKIQEQKNELVVNEKNR
eukprot:UN20063